jgi:hypothetical protein
VRPVVQVLCTPEVDVQPIVCFEPTRTLWGNGMTKQSGGVTATERLLAEFCEQTFLKLWSYQAVQFSFSLARRNHRAKTHSGRILPLTNGGLLEVRMGASQRAGVEFSFAAFAAFQTHGPVDYSSQQFNPMCRN